LKNSNFTFPSGKQESIINLANAVKPISCGRGPATAWRGRRKARNGMKGGRGEGEKGSMSAGREGRCRASARPGPGPTRASAEEAGDGVADVGGEPIRGLLRGGLGERGGGGGFKKRRTLTARSLPAHADI
jgi:hypothetical protein